jgi:molybdopterin-containing oxidoreductase family membrane subunit
MNNSLLNITGDITRPLEGSPNKYWYILFVISLLALGFGLYYTWLTVYSGIGEWGLNKSVGWGWAIVNFVWWIGIGHAGTFISAILLLFRQKWRSSINRAAEAMTIIAILCAAFFPLIHMGRVLLSFYMIPYLNTRNIWVNFNSPLLWDVFAILTYFVVSVLFFYIGLIPDLALLRDRATKKLRFRFLRFFSVNWSGTDNQWQKHTKVSLLLAGMATPLVISVHSVVSLDFATTLVPGWHSTIFPPYFVAGAILSGFAMVLTLVIMVRKAMSLERYITPSHIESMGKIIIVTGSLVALAYVAEIFVTFYSNDAYEISMMLNRMTGPYACGFYMMLMFNLVVPQLFWIKKIRRNIVVVFVLAILINIGMWFERFIIVVTSLQHGFLPSGWRMYQPTMADIALFIGSMGFFLTFFLLFIRIFPVISIYEVKSHEKEL